MDLGFGSARDSLYFKSKGYQVISIDPIKKLFDFYGIRIKLKIMIFQNC